MSKFLIYADISRRQLVSSDGGTFSLPSLTLGDTATFALRVLDRDTAGTLAQRSLTVRSLRASIGPVLQSPNAGMFTLRFTLGHETLPIAPDASAEAIRSAIRSLPEIATYPLAEVIAGTDRGVWLLRFDATGPVPIEAATNRLSPRAFVRVRAYQTNDVWWHELRLIVTPLVFTGSHDRVLPDAPEITRIRAGSPRVEDSTANTNEVQALHVPTDFKGTYYLQFDYRSSRLIGIDDGPDQIAEALNAMWTDGQTRFVVTNPETNHAYIEFTGPLEAWPQPLITISVHTFEEGDLTFSLNLKTAELASALRAVPSIQLPMEVEVEVVDDNADPSDPTVPGQILTLFSAPVTVVREQIWEELASISAVDWLRPPQPRDYIPWTRDQIITGTQSYVAAIGDGASREVTLDHMLGTDALHITVRQNFSGGRRLRDDEFSVVFPSANELTLGFPQEQQPPAVNSLAVVLTSAGPISAFQAHHHTMGQVDGLLDAIATLGTRIGAIEELLPTVNPVATTESSTAASLEIEIPDKKEMLPGNFASDFDFAAAAADAKLLPRPAGLIPAIHDATVEDITLPLPAASTRAGKVYVNAGSTEILVPGGLGRRGSFLEPSGFAGSDGRVWYRLTRDGVTNSFFPTDMERELFMLPINEQMFRAGMKFDLEFKIALQLFKATSRAQYLLVIEAGSAPSQAEPSPTGRNLQDVIWLDTPLLSQRIVVSALKITHKFGCAVRRDINGTLHADQMAYGAWTAADQSPLLPSFTLRARLIQFDTENSVKLAKGTVYYEFTNATAKVQ